MATATPSFGAIGPSQVDPRTGEILDADIGWDSNFVRNTRAMKSEGVITYTPMYDAVSGELNPHGDRHWPRTFLRTFGTRGARSRFRRWRCSKRAVSSTRTVPETDRLVSTSS